MGIKINLVGQVFGRLTVQAESSERKRGSVVWVCLCQCGNIKNITSSYLLNNSTKSCGCLAAEQIPNLLNKKYGKLTVIEKTHGKNKRTVWKCQCDCNNIKYYTTNELNVNGRRSCGCEMRQRKPQQNLINRRFGKLKVIAEELGKYRKRNFTWKCFCECGQITYATTNMLNSGHTSSCGCGAFKNKLINCANGRKQRTKNRQDPKISLSKWVFNKNYADGDLTFEDFYKMSQQNCYYCGVQPSNRLKYCSKKQTQEFKNASLFVYNGLDRKDPNQKHIKNNVVACCMNCNYAKINFSFEEFISQFIKIYKISQKGRIKQIVPEHKYLIEFMFNKGIYIVGKSVRRPDRDFVLTPIGRALEKRFYGRKAKSAKYRYNDGNINFEQFCWLIFQPCYYCNNPYSNKLSYIDLFNIKQFIYINGLDRVDNNQLHNINNIVSCCKYCNYAKRARTQEEFLTWANDCFNNLKKKQNNQTLE